MRAEASPVGPGAASDSVDRDERLDEVMAFYAEHGYARLGHLASEETLAPLRARLDDLMLGRLTYEGMFFQLDVPSGKYEELEFGRGYEGPSLDYRKIEKLEKDPLFWDWITQPLFERIARRVYDAHVSLYRAVVFTKGPATGGSNLPWHQDGGKFWGLDRDAHLQIWTALDDCSLEAGCVEVLPGSHKRGLVTPLGGVVPRDKYHREDVESGVVSLPARAGEVLLIHNYLWHRSGRNVTGKTRRALTACYLHGDTRCLRTKRTPRVFPLLFP